MYRCSCIFRLLLTWVVLWACPRWASCLRRQAFLSVQLRALRPASPRAVVSAVCAEPTDAPGVPELPGASCKTNLFKHQLDDYSYVGAQTVKDRDGERWQDIVMEEIAKNRNVQPSDDFLFGEQNAEDLNVSAITSKEMEVTMPSYNYRLSPEGRLKLEDRISHLKRLACTNPGNPKSVRPNLWIVRSTFGHYCELLEKDEDRLKSFVKRVRSHFSPDQLQILKMQLEVKMPLCEVFFEGDITDMVRIFYARGGTLQFYVAPRFWTRCPLLEKDARLEAKYGKSAAPGLFPQWDEDGMIEELIDCMDVRPDYALEFRQPSAWHMIPMVPDHDKALMQTLFDKVHWPTRLRVQRAFEDGIEDYRDVISDEYKMLQRMDRRKSNILDYWLPPNETL